MAYDADLADRVRQVLPADADVTERKMFGGLTFLLAGHMFAGIVGSELMFRLGHEGAQMAAPGTNPVGRTGCGCGRNAVTGGAG
jgi:TfoX/Sxy family transcriptional regulator of competence genes